MPKNKRKKKHKGYAPPLTFLDKLLYVLFLILFCAISISPLIIATIIQNKLTFKDPSAVAFGSTGSLFWTFPISLFLLITVLVLGICGLENKIPLFGNPRLQYGEPPFKKNIYPIFKRKQYVTDAKTNKKTWYKGLIIMWSIIFLVLACLYPLGICGRRVLFEDSTIKTYNSFNSVKRTYSTEDYDHFTLDTYISRSRYGAGRWVYKVEIKTNDGKKISFRNYVSEKAIDEFIEIKESLNHDQITIKRAHNLEKVIENNNFDSTTSDKLRELFSTP